MAVGCKKGLTLDYTPRSEGGFRQYGESDIDTLGFVRRTQGLGFTLGEVRELLALRQSRLQPCAPVRRRLEQKLVHVHHKLTDLEKLERELRLALRSCNRELHKRFAHCPLLADKNQLKPKGRK